MKKIRSLSGAHSKDKKEKGRELHDDEPRIEARTNGYCNPIPGNYQGFPPALLRYWQKYRVRFRCTT